MSKRGLILAGRSGETVLLEHPRAAQLPTLLEDDPDPTELLVRMGPPISPDLVSDLVQMGILVDSRIDEVEQEMAVASVPRQAVTFTSSGMMITGIARPSQWLNDHLVPVIISPPGKIILALISVAGLVALLAGRPDLPKVSTSPGIEALLMLLFGLAAIVCHEFGHAVALVHFGMVPRRAGFGFYWGEISFFVDSTPALVLNRRERVTQALAGVLVDVITTAIFAIAAHAVPGTLLALVFWRRAILGVIDIIVNLTPVLELDGHWALADLLDEPDLAPRARRALGAMLKGKIAADQKLLAFYGAVSLVGGFVLLAISAVVYWFAVSDLVFALFAGNPAEMIIGLYYIIPVALGIIVSAIGLVLQTVGDSGELEADPDDGHKVNAEK